MYASISLFAFSNIFRKLSCTTISYTFIYSCKLESKLILVSFIFYIFFKNYGFVVTFYATREIRLFFSYFYTFLSRINIYKYFRQLNTFSSCIFFRLIIFYWIADLTMPTKLGSFSYFNSTRVTYT